jgi:cation:H+ antiporter
VTHLRDELRDVHPGRQGLGIGLAMGVAIPGVLMRFIHPHIAHPIEAVIFGLAIVGAAFLLSWAAEVAQLDISAGLAIAVLALIAVLPEYAVDMVFAFRGGQAVQAYGPACHPPGAPGETACSLALANMTGANRLLIGIGWSLVVLIAYARTRRRPEGPIRVVTLDREHAVEVSFLALATLYSLTLPLKSSVTLVDAAILVAIFVAYTIRISRAPAEEPHLVGPARLLGTFRVGNRRLSVVGLFVFSAGVIVACAAPFAESLVATGRDYGINEFLLVQWLAPLASEAPELLVAGLFAWRLNTNAGLGTLVSSKVNQWTLLVGTLPIVFAIASASVGGLPIDTHQREELLLTAAQSFFALAVLVSLSISTREAILLFTLFWAQFLLGGVVPERAGGIERVIVAVVYLVLGLGIFVRQRHLVVPLLRDGLRTSYARLSAAGSGSEIVGE